MRQILDLENHQSFIHYCSGWAAERMSWRQAAACRRQRMHELCLKVFPAASHTSCGKELLFEHYWPEIFVWQINSLSYTWNYCLHKIIYTVYRTLLTHCTAQIRMTHYFSHCGCSTTQVVIFTVKHDLSASRGGGYVICFALSFITCIHIFLYWI